MDILSNGQILAQKRSQLALSQTDLARLSGVRRERLSRFENDTENLRPRELRKLLQTLNLDAHDLTVVGKHPDQAAVKRSFRSKAPRRLLRTEVSFSRLRSRYGELAGLLLREIDHHDDSGWRREFLRWAGCESADELLLCLRLLARPEVTPVWLSLAEVGFVKHPSVDKETDEATHGHKCPTLFLRLQDWQALIFPQVSLRTRRGQYRLDFLAKLRAFRRSIWLNLEVDGGGHDHNFDQRRQDSLALPTVRISGREVERHDCLPVLLARLGQRLKPDR